MTYPKVKITFDVTCLAVTAGLTFFGLGRVAGLGVGTVVAAFTMGKAVGLMGDWMDKHVTFVSFLDHGEKQPVPAGQSKKTA